VPSGAQLSSKHGEVNERQLLHWISDLRHVVHFTTLTPVAADFALDDKRLMLHSQAQQ
jgi:hypothetical protein